MFEHICKNRGCKAGLCNGTKLNNKRGHQQKQIMHINEISMPFTHEGSRNEPVSLTDTFDLPGFNKSDSPICGPLARTCAIISSSASNNIVVSLKGLQYLG